MVKKKGGLKKPIDETENSWFAKLNIPIM